MDTLFFVFTNRRGDRTAISAAPASIYHMMAPGVIR
jgi:hypothetical protein